jgi:hypothetical protein
MKGKYLFSTRRGKWCTALGAVCVYARKDERNQNTHIEYEWLTSRRRKGLFNQSRYSIYPRNNNKIRTSSVWRQNRTFIHACVHLFNELKTELVMTKQTTEFAFGNDDDWRERKMEMSCDQTNMPDWVENQNWTFLSHAHCPSLTHPPT